MKKFTCVVLLFLLSLILLPSISSQAQSSRCLSFESHQLQLEIDAAYRNRYEEHLRQQYIRNEIADVERTDADTIIIPVVVHVLYNKPEQNISDEQIQSQIDVLNEDFALINASSLNIPSVWDSLKRDSRLRFVIAKTDPNGALTRGITRTASPVYEFTVNDSRIYSTAAGGMDPWPSRAYLNLWVVGRLEGNALGFANFPGSAQDGVVITHKAFGRIGTLTDPYNLGRTGTHEVGHWLSLQHIWGDDADNCTKCDFPDPSPPPACDPLDDTPNQSGPNFRCRDFPYTDNCSPVSPGIMFMNYMDYTDDKCMMFFTKGQIRRMRATLDVYPRDSIRLSQGSRQLGLWNHDAAIDSILSPVTRSLNRCLVPEIRIANNGSDTIYSLVIRYCVLNGIQKEYKWTGVLAPLQKSNVVLPGIGAGNGSQVMEFRIFGSDDNNVNNYMSTGFALDGNTAENCLEQGLIAFPNPITGNASSVCVKAAVKDSQEATICMFNTLGQMVYSEQKQINPGDSFRVMLNDLPSGIYTVAMYGEKFSGATRVMYLPTGANTGFNPSLCD